MNTINELAKDYAIENSLIGHEKPPYRGFIAGFEEAQRWIPIEEELPEDADNIIESGKYSYTEHPVITLTCNGRYSISKRTRYDKSEWKWSGSSSFSESIISWRPIQRT